MAIVDPQHRTSQQVLTKLGMQPVGRDHILDRTWIIYEATGQRELPKA